MYQIFATAETSQAWLWREKRDERPLKHLTELTRKAQTYSKGQRKRSGLKNENLA